MSDTYIVPGKSKALTIEFKNSFKVPGVSNRIFYTYINQQTGREEIWNKRIANGNPIDSTFRQIATRFASNEPYVILPEGNNITPAEKANLNTGLNSTIVQNQLKNAYKNGSLAYANYLGSDPNSALISNGTVSITNPSINKLVSQIYPGSASIPAGNGDPQPSPATQANEPESEGATSTTQQIAELAKQGISDIAGYESPEFSKRYGSILDYPLNLASTKQDYIKFDIIEYRPRTVSEKNKFTFNKRYGTISSKDILTSIVLPIQPNATDLNAVSWNPDVISAVELGLTGVSASAISGTPPTDIATGIINQIKSLGGEFNSDAEAALRMFISRKAANVTGDADKFMSRILGSIINPNLELIFNAPQMRPFQFNFQLTPRSAREGTRVKNIIRVLKEASAVRRGIGDLFLKAPHVFQLSYWTYQSGRYILHPAMNKFKICALRNINVDYTPMNTYSTYADGTMTAYNMGLEFSEIEPVYADDYLVDKELGIVGY